jgi:hypothetical protein
MDRSSCSCSSTRHTLIDRVQDARRHIDHVTRMHLDSVKHAETSVDVLAYDQRLEVVAGYVLLQAQVDLSTFDDVPGLGFAVRLAEVLSCERDVRMRVDREALTGSQKLD